MTFEEWWNEFNSCCPLDITEKEIAKWTWEAAFDEGVKWTLQQDANSRNKIQLTQESALLAKLMPEEYGDG